MTGCELSAPDRITVYVENVNHDRIRSYHDLGSGLAELAELGKSARSGLGAIYRHGDAMINTPQLRWLLDEIEQIASGELSTSMRNACSTLARLPAKRSRSAATSSSPATEASARRRDRDTSGMEVVVLVCVGIWIEQAKRPVRCRSRVVERRTIRSELSDPMCREREGHS